MRTTKGIGVVAAGLLVMTALVAASSASAAQTVLCKAEEVPCALANRWEGILFEMKAEPLKLLNNISNVECTSSKASGVLGNSGAPQKAALGALSYTGCKMATGTACEINVLELGELDLLRTNVNLGEGTLLGTEILLKCGAFIHCRYRGAPVFHLLGKTATETAKLTATEVILEKVGGLLCPTTTKLDATYVILAPLPAYVSA